MPVMKDHTAKNALDRLLKKVAASKGEANVPPTSNPTGSIPDGTTEPTKGVTATEQKPKVKETVQGSPFDGSKMPEGEGEHEHGIKRMESGEKSSITPEMADNDAKKLASLSLSELLAKHAAAATPLAAQLLVDAATGATTPSTPEIKAASSAVPAPASAPAATPAEVQKAAQEGFKSAEELTREFLVNTVHEAEEAADLLASFTKLSQDTQKKLAAEAQAKKKADDAGMPMGGPGPVPAGGPGAGAMPPDAAGGDMPPVPPDAGGAMPPDAGAVSPPPDAGAAGLGGAGGQIDEKQLEQLLLALLEQHGSADPKSLEDSEDPGTKAIGKQARAFMKAGKFQVRPVKDAKDRAAIDQMKAFIRETAR